MSGTTPTKSNLINAQTSLELSQKAFELLDKKRNVLIREMMNLLGNARRIQDKIENTFNEAYKALEVANITMGISTVEDVYKRQPSISFKKPPQHLSDLFSVILIIGLLYLKSL